MKKEFKTKLILNIFIIIIAFFATIGIYYLSVIRSVPFKRFESLLSKIKKNELNLNEMREEYFTKNFSLKFDPAFWKNVKEVKWYTVSTSFRPSKDYYYTKQIFNKYKKIILFFQKDISFKAWKKKFYTYLFKRYSFFSKPFYISKDNKDDFYIATRKIKVIRKTYFFSFTLKNFNKEALKKYFSGDKRFIEKNKYFIDILDRQLDYKAKKIKKKQPIDEYFRGRLEFIIKKDNDYKPIINNIKL